VKYIIVLVLVIVAMFIYQRINAAKAARRKREEAKNRATLQEILDAKR